MAQRSIFCEHQQPIKRCNPCFIEFCAARDFASGFYRKQLAAAYSAARPNIIIRDSVSFVSNHPVLKPLLYQLLDFLERTS